MESESIIADHHNKLFHLFHESIDAAKNPARDFSPYLTNTILSNEFDRYKVWAGNVGAMHRGPRFKLSLDYRLSEATFKRQVVVFLRNLEKNVSVYYRSKPSQSKKNNEILRIQKALELLLASRQPAEETAPQTTGSSHDAGRTDSSSDEELDDSPWEISDDEESNDHDMEASSSAQSKSDSLTSSFGKIAKNQGEDLDHSNVGIRKPTMEMPYLVEEINFIITCLYKLPLRTPASFRGPIGRSSLDISIYQHFDQMYAKDKFPLASDLLATRLGKMISRRRQLLHLRKTRDKALMTDIVEPPTTTKNYPERSLKIGINETKDVTETQELRSPSSARMSQSQANVSQRSIMTAATRVDQSTMLETPALSDYAPSAPSYYTSKQRIEVPKRPKGNDGEELDYFKCPYCFLATHVTSSHLWKRHVLRDIQPYICTFDACELSEHMFEKRDEWYQHELQIHRVEWHCGQVGHSASKTETEFLEHMEKEHDMPIKSFKETAFTNMFRRPHQQTVSNCPLCQRETEDLKTHLAHHLEQVALFSLPRENELPDMDSGANIRGSADDEDGDGSQSDDRDSRSAEEDETYIKDMPKVNIYDIRDGGYVFRDTGMCFTDSAEDPLEIIVFGIRTSSVLLKFRVGERDEIYPMQDKLLVWKDTRALGFETTTERDLMMEIINEKKLVHANKTENVPDMDASVSILSWSNVYATTRPSHFEKEDRTVLQKFAVNSQEIAGRQAAASLGSSDGSDTNVDVDVDADIDNDSKILEPQNKLFRERSSAERFGESVDSASNKLWVSEHIQNYEFYLEQRQAGTCEWIFATKEFNEWHSQPTGTLLCHGRPGVGKSVLASSIVFQALKEAENVEKMGVAYIFCSIERRHEETPGTILMAIILQLLKTAKSYISNVLSLSLFEELCRSGKSVSADKCLDCLEKVAQDFSTVTVVIDGLDECSVECRESLLDKLGGIGTTLKNLRLLLTTRSSPDVFLAFRGATSLEIHAKAADVRAYVEHRLRNVEDERRTTPFSEESKEKILLSLPNSVAGLFLLAPLYMTILGNITHESLLEQTLRALPRSLQETYAYIMQTTRAHTDTLLARKILSFMVYGFRRLSILEVQAALGVDAEGEPTIDRILRVCLGLVILDKKQTLRFLHLTVLEHLLSDKQQDLQSHRQLATTCLRYLASNEFSNGPCETDADLQKRLTEHKFLRYAATFWDKHHKASENFNSAIVLSFLLKEGNVSSCIQVLWLIEPYVYVANSPLLLNATSENPRNWTGLHLVCYLGLTDLANLLVWKSEVYISACDEVMRTPLYFAAKGGYIDIVDTILNHNSHAATVNDLESASLRVSAECGRARVVTRLLQLNRHSGYHLECSLYSAATNGHIEVVQILLDHGTDPDTPQVLSDKAIVGATINGKPEVVRLLIARGANVDTLSSGGRTALSYGAQHGRFRIVPMLLESGASVDAHSDDNRTPLSYAAETNRIVVVGSLLNAGANVNSMDNTGRTPLSWACHKGNLPVVEKLLEAGANIDMTGDDGRTPLLWAAENGRRLIVERLLGLGAPVDAQDERGRSPLSHAAERSRPAIISSLISAEATIDLADKNGRSPLSWAAQFSGKLIVHSLLDSGAAIDVADARGRTPLIWAAVEGNIHTAAELISSGAKIGNRDKTGWTALHHAVAEDNLEMVRLLLEHGAPVEVQRDDNDTPLTIAVEKKRRKEIVEILLELGAEPANENVYFNKQQPVAIAGRSSQWEILDTLLNHGSPKEQTRVFARHLCLITAARDGNAEFLRRILEKPNISLEYLDKREGQTALIHATRRANIPIMEMLLDNGASVDARDTHGGSALAHAAEGFTPNIVEKLSEQGLGMESIAKLLLDRGAVVDLRDEGNATPLFRAAESGHKETAKLLLDHRANVDARDNFGMTALFKAAALNRVQTVEILLGHGASVDAADQEERRPLLLAAMQGHLEACQLLLKNGADVGFRDEKLWTPLFGAVRFCHYPIVILLLDHRAPANVQGPNGETPLYIVAKGKDENSLNIARSLLKSGAKPDLMQKVGRTPLFEAVQSGSLPMALLLIEKGADVNFKGELRRIALSVAVDCGHVAIADMLLQNESKVDHRDYLERTPLFDAAKHNRTEMIDLLRKWGASTECRDFSGRTPLFEAAEHGHLAAVQQLISYGAKVNVIDDYNGTPLSTAARSRRLDIVEFLLLKGADPNLNPVAGSDLCLEAVRDGNADMVALLLRAGCKVDAESMRHYASDPNMLGILKRHGL